LTPREAARKDVCEDKSRITVIGAKALKPKSATTRVW
jgi:hypothetical protein